MRPGSSTYRPNVTVLELVPKLQARGFTSAAITTPEGRVLGMFVVADLEEHHH
jgi:hypothetical protein